MVDYTTKKVGDVFEYLIDLIAAILPFSVESHIWQEFHHNAATMVYNGATNDDRQIVENPDGGVLQPKQRLHLCFLETAIVTIDVNITRGTYRAYWQIIDSADNLVKEHPQFTKANYDANDASARLQTGKYGWRWDGRNNDTPPLFVSSGIYRSRITVKDDKGAQIHQSDTSIEVEGDPYRIIIVGRPKTDAELNAEFARSALNNRLLRANPQTHRGCRISGDCWIKVYRGLENDGHIVFLGQGAIEATSDRTIATPHTPREYKGWIRRNPRGIEQNPDRVQIQDLGDPSTGIIRLDNPGGPSPINPDNSNQPSKAGVQTHAGSRTEWVTRGMSLGCTCVKRIIGATVSNHGSVYRSVRSVNSSFGGWGSGPGQDVAVAGPDFVNKQTKRNRIQDALIADNHNIPELNPPEETPPLTGPPAPDEPLHMQPTMQQGVFGGFNGHEIPRSARQATDNPSNRLRIRMRLEDYARGSMYYQYHHLVVFGHTWERVTNGFTFTGWIPRKVIRTWRNNRRNLLIRGNCQISWYLERRLIGGLEGSPEIFHGLYPIGTSANYAPLRLADLGRVQRSWTYTSPLPPGEYRSIFNYRVRLRPYAHANDWEPEAEAIDIFSGSQRASIAAERLVTVGRRHYFEGSNELMITRIEP